MSEKPQRPNGIPIDTVFSVLSNEHRQVVLTSLLRENGPVSVEALIDHIVREVCPVDESRPDKLRTSMAVRLHHVHLPLLHDAGMIDYDPERKMAEVTDAGQMIKPIP
ncbi:DUF7344 domain-containing protein [Haladaptatus halobius]|uniref:DUF7344 domain-containing protein n=1 Tax=Haladaptatus halobius TaxID=2884875 RepID=UPI001D0AEEF5|nr:hypothetical protein [Haladaptatus halobius]